MKQLIFLFLLSLGFQLQSGYAQIKQKNLYKTVAVLTSDSLAGRKAGTGYDLKTARYLEKQLTDMGYKPLYGQSGIQEFKYKTRRNADSLSSYNVVMVLKSEKPDVSSYFLIGAHHDHLGMTEQDGKTVIYRGANDNATGVASMLEIARNLHKERKQLNRHILVAAFGAEEIGLIGSKALSERIQKDSLPVHFMLNLEMTGCLNGEGEVEVIGKDTFPVEEAIQSVKNTNNLNFTYLNCRERGSDHLLFMKYCPVTVFATTGSEVYHTPKDDLSSLNFKGMKKLTEYILEFAKQQIAK